MASLSDLPIGLERGTVVYPFSRDYPGTAWIWDIQAGHEGSPVIVHTVCATNNKHDFRYYYATRDATERIWRSQEIARAGAGLYRQEQFYVGGTVIDKKDPNIVYCSTAIDPSSGRVTPHREIYAGRRQANKSFVWSALTADSPEDNIRPFVPASAKVTDADKSSLLWMQGRYTSYKRFDCKIMLLEE